MSATGTPNGEGVVVHTRTVPADQFHRVLYESSDGSFDTRLETIGDEFRSIEKCAADLLMDHSGCYGFMSFVECLDEAGALEVLKQAICEAEERKQRQ